MKTIAFAAAFLAVVYVAQAIQCPPKNEEDVTLLPNPNNCSTFYLCNDGIPYLMSCPPGLNFNSELRVCDLPENADCVPEEPTTEPEDPEEPTTEPEDPEEPTTEPEDPEEPTTEPEDPEEPITEPEDPDSVEV